MAARVPWDGADLVETPTRTGSGLKTGSLSPVGRRRPVGIETSLLHQASEWRSPLGESGSGSGSGDGTAVSAKAGSGSVPARGGGTGLETVRGIATGVGMVGETGAGIVPGTLSVLHPPGLWRRRRPSPRRWRLHLPRRRPRGRIHGGGPHRPPVPPPVVPVVPHQVAPARRQRPLGTDAGRASPSE